MITLAESHYNDGRGIQISVSLIGLLPPVRSGEKRRVNAKLPTTTRRYSQVTRRCSQVLERSQVLSYPRRSHPTVSQVSCRCLAAVFESQVGYYIINITYYNYWNKTDRISMTMTWRGLVKMTQVSTRFIYNKITSKKVKQ